MYKFSNKNTIGESLCFLPLYSTVFYTSGRLFILYRKGRTSAKTTFKNVCARFKQVLEREVPKVKKFIYMSLYRENKKVVYLQSYIKILLIVNVPVRGSQNKKYGNKTCNT